MKLLNHIQSRGRAFVMELLKDQSACRTYVRLLSPVCQHVLFRLIYINDISRESFLKMFMKGAENYFNELRNAFVLIEFIKENEKDPHIKIEPLIKEVLLNSKELSNSNDNFHTSNLNIKVIDDYFNGCSKTLDDFAINSLNNILVYLLDHVKSTEESAKLKKTDPLYNEKKESSVNIGNTNQESDKMKKLLITAGILKKDAMFQTKEFLLSSPKTQIWTIIENILNETYDIDSYRFILNLGGQQYSHGYPLSGLTDIQISYIENMLSIIGLVYVENGYYYPTKSILNFFGKSILFDVEGWLFIDTNFKISAYPKTEIQSRLLQLFTKTSYEIPGHFLSCYISPGTIFGKGSTEKISLQTVVDFLEANVSKIHGEGKIPDVILKQFQVWERQRNRFTVHTKCIYRQLYKGNQPDKLRKIAEQMGCLLYFREPTEEKNFWEIVTKEEMDNEFVEEMRRVLSMY